MKKRPSRRIKKVGYAMGGPVMDNTASSYGVASDTGTTTEDLGPATMSVALDSRSHDPNFSDEDASLMATRPEGAPSAPDENSYKNGGPVRRTGYATGGEVDDGEDSQEDQDEGGREEVGQEDVSPPQDEEVTPPTQLAENETERAPEEGSDPEAAPARTGYAPAGGGEGEDSGEDAGGDGGGGGGSPQQPEAGQKTGYNQHQQPQDDPPQSMLKNALDWLQRSFGLVGSGPAPGQQPKPQEDRPLYAQDNGMAPINAIAAAGRALYDKATEGRDGLPRDTYDPVGMADESARGTLNDNAPHRLLQKGAQALFGAKDAGATQVQNPRQTQPSLPQTATDPRQAQAALRDYINGARAFTPDQMTELLNRTSRDNPNLDMNGAIGKTFGDLMKRGETEAAGKFLQALRPSYDNVRAAAIAAASQGAMPQALKLASQMNNLLPNGKTVNFMQMPSGNVGVTIRDDRGQQQQLTMTQQQFGQYLKGSNSLFDVAGQQGIKDSIARAGAEPMMQPGQRQTGYAYSGQVSPEQMNRLVYGENAPHKELLSPQNRRIEDRDEQVYKRDTDDFKLRQRAYQAFPGERQEAQRAKMLDRLRGESDRVTSAREREAQKTERAKLQDQRLRDAADKQDMTRAQSDLYRAYLMNRKDAAANGQEYKPTPQEQRLLEQLSNRAFGGRQQQAAPQQSAPQQQDYSTYRGDTPPAPAPQGMQWGRSRSTGQWSLRPVQ